MPRTLCCTGAIIRAAQVLGLAAVLAAAAAPAYALPVVTAGPTISAVPNAELARLVDVTTEIPSRLSVSVSDGLDGWDRAFKALQTAHSVPLFGLKPDRTYDVVITLEDGQGNPLVLPAIEVVTGPLPPTFPPLEILVSDPTTSLLERRGP